MAHLGTGVQIAAVGPQNAFLDVQPEARLFEHSTVRSTRFASEYVEDLALQTVKFGSTAVFEMPPRGDLLGHMHLEFRIPAVQPLLGECAAQEPPVMQGAATPSATVGWPALQLYVVLENFSGVVGSVRSMEGGGGSVWVYEFMGQRWELAIYASGYVVSTLYGGAARQLTLFAQTTTVKVSQPPGRSVGMFVAPGGAVVTRNDTWRAPLAYMLMRRVRFLVDDLVVHDHERLWYDMHDRLTAREGHTRGLAELLGTDLSMGQAHTVFLPLKLLSSGKPRAFFPIILVPKCRVKVELQVESFAGCVPSGLGVEAAQPSSLAVKLVGERVLLDPEERNAMLLRPLTIMYEGAQDMDALNYVEGGEGQVVKSSQAAIDLSELNLPVKALLWVVYAESVAEPFQYLDVVEWATLQFGSQERVLADGPTFSRQQVHSHAPRCLPGNVYMYSFALQAWSTDPCGAVDFSLVQKPVLRLRLKPEAAAMQLKCKVWGVTYNWLTFQGGKITRLFST